MSQEKVLEIFESSGGILKGHFLLTSGRHSDQYMQCAKLFVDPTHSTKLCSELSKKFRSLHIDVVASPAIGGIIMGYEMARQLKCQNVFCERVNGKMELRRGFAISKGMNVLVVEDVVTTGGSVKEVMELIKDLGGNIVGVGSIVDRSAGKVDFGVKFESLISMDIPSYEADQCPICKQGIPIIKPGSRDLK
ncbi:MAG TPA: orotate phosphoribosyltransferase [Clostridia bacterium]